MLQHGVTQPLFYPCLLVRYTSWNLRQTVGIMRVESLTEKYLTMIPTPDKPSDILRAAQQLVADLREMYPMYAASYFGDVERLLSEIVNAQPITNEDDRQALLAKLGELTVAVYNARYKIECGA